MYQSGREQRVNSLRAYFFFVCRCFFFLQNHAFCKSISGIPPECQTVWICLDPLQDRRFVGPDLGPNCLQQFISADDPSSSRVKESLHVGKKCHIGIDFFMAKKVREDEWKWKHSCIWAPCVHYSLHQ